MPASVKSPRFTSLVQHKVKHTSWQDADFHADDFGLDLADLSSMTGFLMNEVPDSSGHFYPPWANDPVPLVKDEPSSFMMPEPAPARPSRQQQPQQPQQQQQQAPAAPVADPALDDVIMGGTSARPSTSIAASGSSAGSRLAKAPGTTAVTGGTGGTGGTTLRKTAAGGVTRRRASSKEEQAKKRRERNRVLARRTRLRKKFFFQSLQQQVARLQRENERLKNIVTTRCPGSSEDILVSCAASKTPSMVADRTRQATALLDQSGFLLVKALQSSQPSFCVTDPQMPDNPIVYASDSFIELTGYDRSQVLGRNCRFLQGPDTDPDAVAKIRKGIEEGSDTSVYLRQYKADGTVFWNHVFVAALRNSEHKIINYVGIQHPLDKEPSAEVVACINNGEERLQSAQQEEEEEERQAGWGGQWNEGGNGNEDLAALDFMASGWGTD
uniref:Putative LOV domain-containing protein n=1 Tax=Colpomenia sinuosa TaxID=87236 RepID=A0A126X141_9PHAE|nr:putative LOV domain-containing protein [Colpomenia sinuosa]